MDYKYAIIGFVRFVGSAALFGALAWFGDVNNLAFLSPGVSGLIAALALAIEHAIESSTGKALFGAAKV